MLLLRSILVFAFGAHFAAAAGSGGYAGSRVCAGCHQTQYAAQSAGGHFHSLSLPGEHQLGAKFPGKSRFWAFGAGTQAVTFVRQLDEETWVEDHDTWYTKTGRFDLTPGHQTIPEPERRDSPGVRYKAFAPEASLLRCFQCHSTGPLALTETAAIQPFETGVRCEVCHGPGAAHSAKPSAASIFNPKRLDAAGLNRFCGQCHRPPAGDLEQVDWGDPWNVRHQPMYLSRSRCFLESRGRLSCLTCHDPHAPLAETAVEQYTARCAGCHATESLPKSHSDPSHQGCTACHMPGVRPREELTFHNHWIGLYRPGDPIAPRR